MNKKHIKKMLNVTDYQRNTNQNYNEVSPHTVRIAISKMSTNNKCCKKCPEEGTFQHCWWECKLIKPLLRMVWRFLNKLQIEPPYDPAIPLLDRNLEKTIPQNDICTLMFIAVLFTAAKTRKQPQ